MRKKKVKRPKKPNRRKKPEKRGPKEPEYWKGVTKGSQSSEGLGDCSAFAKSADGRLSPCLAQATVKVEKKLYCTWHDPRTRTYLFVKVRRNIYDVVQDMVRAARKRGVLKKYTQELDELASYNEKVATQFGRNVDKERDRRL